MAQIIKTTFKLRRGTAAEWDLINPILAEGEPGFAIDTNILKIGNGKDTWKNLIAINDAAISADGQTITYNQNHQISLAGFDTAKQGQIPIKTTNSTLSWIDPNNIFEEVIFNGGEMTLNSLTSFYIGIRGYDALPGMTWDEWVNSVYNIDGYVNIDNFIFDFAFENLVVDKANNLMTTDNFITSQQYELTAKYGLFNELNKVVAPWSELHAQAINVARDYEIESNLQNNSNPAHIINKYADAASLTRSPNAPITLTLPRSATFGHIGNAAFKGLKSVKTIYIPNNVKEIGESAFANCVDLQKIIVADDNPYLYSDENGILYTKNQETLLYCPPKANITHFTTPYSTRTIAANAFENCVNLVEINLMNVRHIGEAAFKNCANLNRVYLSDNITRLEPYAFVGCDNLKYNQFYAADGYVSEYLGSTQHPELVLIKAGINPSTQLYTVDPPVRVIAPFAFTSANIKTLRFTIESQLRTIEKDAFRGSKLELIIDIPKQLNYIGKYAFASTRLTSVSLPEVTTEELNEGKGIRVIDDFAFMNCWRITHFAIPYTIQEVGVDIIDSTNLQYISKDNCYYLGFNEKPSVLMKIAPTATTAFIDSNISAIAPYAAANATNLTLIDFRGGKITNKGAERITKIPAYAFKNCTQIKKIILPDNIDTIGYGAFEGCTSLVSINIGPHLRKVEKNAFKNTQIKFIKCLYPSSTQMLQEWFNIEFENPEANPAHAGAQVYQDVRTWGELAVGPDITEIKDYAFYGQKNITSVNLNRANSLQYIGTQAFYNCTNLQGQFTIPSSVKIIGEGITGFTQINSFISKSPHYTTYDDNKLLGSEEVIYNGIYITILQAAHGGTTVEFNIPKSSTIGRFAFAGSVAGALNFGKDSQVRSIGDYAFKGMKIKKGDFDVRLSWLPPKAVAIGVGIFEGADLLTDLICPGSIADVKLDMFKDLVYDLATVAQFSIQLSEGVVKISAGAFGAMGQILEIPVSCKIIEDGAIGTQNNPVSIKYAGTQEQWNKISMGLNNYFKVLFKA